ncbi:MAG: glucosylglycerate hydrolase [Propionibacteriaceae bacterium]
MPLSTSGLAGAAAEVLRRNDRGGRTIAAPNLYPHQWSWDAAFVAAGLGEIDTERALTELANLLRGQWSTGMIPQIVFSDRPGYFPGPDRWRSEVAAASPPNVQTSGICQPPVHSWALFCIHRSARERGEEGLVTDFLHDHFDALLAWHRWLTAVRAPSAGGLVEIHHGWESGMDNSPRWDAAYARVTPKEMAPFERLDLAHVADHAQRPSDADYQRYIWLVDQLVGVDYDDTRTRAVIDFRVGDVLFTALHSLASRLLADLAMEIGRTGEAAELREMGDRFAAAVQATVDPDTGLARDYDVRAGCWLPAETLAGFAPLLCGTTPELQQRQLDLLMGPRWCGHPSLRVPTLPTTSPASAAFVSSNYWRGPQWPVINWLFSWALDHHGATSESAAIRAAGLRQLSDGTFAEYYDSVTGAPLGSMDQSWTAAAALGWRPAAERDVAPAEGGVR